MITLEMYWNLHPGVVSHVDASIKQCDIPKVKDLFLPSFIMLFLLFSHSVMSDFCDPMGCIACQAPLSMEFSR